MSKTSVEPRTTTSLSASNLHNTSPSHDFSLIDEASIECQLTSPIVDLISVLSKRAYGYGILTYYKKRHTLTEIHRTQLVEIVIDEEIRSCWSLT